MKEVLVFMGREIKSYEAHFLFVLVAGNNASIYASIAGPMDTNESLRS